MAALRMKSICLSVLVALLALVHLCSAAQHTVGDSSGWTLGVNYTQWAATKTFQVGDTLLFPYAQGAHNVLEVSRADHDSCTTTKAISTYANANAVVTLSKSGQHWFICGISGHCPAGMKLAVNVLDATSTAASPAPAPARSSSSPAPSPRRASPAPVSRSPISAPTPTPAAAEGPTSGGVVPPTPPPASSEAPATSPSAEQVPPPPTFSDTPAASPPSSGSSAMSSQLAAGFSSAAVVAAGLAFLM